MKKYGKLILLTGLLGITIASCKLDAPVLPGDPDYLPYTPTGGEANTGAVTGTTGTGNNVNNSNISGTWTLKKTQAGIYNQNNVLISGTPTFNLFTSVTINEAGKAIEFLGSFSAIGPGTYTLAGSGTTLHIQTSADPFERSINDRIRITNLTATAMTWVAIDPHDIVTNGQTYHSGFEVTFIK